MITSANNTQVKNVIQLNQKAKARKEQGLFVAEGRKMFGEAPVDWVEKVYITESLANDEKIMEKVKSLSEEKAEIVADNIFRQMCDTKTPQGVLTVLKKPTWTIKDILKGPAPLVMVLEMQEQFSGQGREPVFPVYSLPRPVWILQIQK